MLITIVELMD